MALKPDKAALTQYLSAMQPGDTLSGLQFSIVDKNGNSIDLSNTTILCRKRYSAKKNKKTNPRDYRFEVFKDSKLGSGMYGEVFPIIATLKLHAKQIEILKKETGKQRVIKVETKYPGKKSCAKNEADIGKKLSYLHMKPIAQNNKNEPLVSNYIVMRRMPGETVFDLLKNSKLSNLTHTKQLLLFLSLLEALQVLHQQGIFHGDIKNDNLMVGFVSESTRLLQANIIDVGLSRRAEGNSAAFLTDVLFMGKVFSEIVKFLGINDPIINQLIEKMMATKSEQRISLENAIFEVQTYYLREYDQSKLAHLQLPLLQQLSRNKVFESLLKNYLANKKIANETQSIVDLATDEKQYFSGLNQTINLFAILTAFKKSHETLGSVLIDSFFMALKLAAQEEDDHLNNLRQSVVQAIFCYVQNSYKSDSQDRCASERRINDIKSLLSIVENSPTEKALHSAIIKWDKSIERGGLNNSELSQRVAKAIGLEKSMVNQYSFWSRIYVGPLPDANNCLPSKLHPRF